MKHSFFAFLLLGLLFLTGSCGRESPPGFLDQASSLASQGKIQEAEALLKGRAADAAQGERAFPEAFAETRGEVRRWKKAFAEARQMVRAAIEREGTTGAIVALREIRARVQDRYLELALRKSMSRIQEIAAEMKREKTGGLGVASKHSDSEARVVDEAASEGEVMGRALELLLEDVQALARRGFYAKAIAMLREQMDLGGSQADRLRDLLWEIEAKAKKEMEGLVERAEKMRAGGDTKGAVAFLREESKRFPERGPLSRLRHVLEDWRQEELSERARLARKMADPFAPPKKAFEAAKKYTEDNWTRMSQAIGMRAFEAAAEAAGGIAKDFEDAALPQAAEFRLRERMLRGLAGLLEKMKARVREDRKVFQGLDFGMGRKGDLFDVEGLELILGKKEREHLPLSGVTDVALGRILEKVASGPRELLPVAWWYLRAKDRRACLRLLVRAAQGGVLRGDAEAKGAIPPELGRMVALARGEEYPEGGYAFEKGAFVSKRDIELRSLARKLRTRLRRVFALRSDQARDAAYAKLSRGDLRLLPVLIQLFEEKKSELVASLSKSPIRSSMKKLQALRRELDKRRAYAKKLIFDEKRYFYPYKPPAVSAEKAKEYAKVQAEVDRRVAAVREIWDGKNIAASLSPRVARQLSLYRWVVGRLAGLGRRDPEADQRVDLLLAPAKLNIRSVALDMRDRRFIDKGDAIVARNKKMLEAWVQKGKVLRTEAILIQITNAYRRMLGHIPLRADLRLIRSSRGHCEEMAKLGYFSHFSPTPGRRSPFDRMRLAGYSRGAGENLAINLSAYAALNAWLHSSGHHRNLLFPSHVDIGTGNAGRYWCQNFGRGD
ncbi:MAG TPA: hypothetical protein ENK02_10275 [Planctomycetes bacterium]|nr:hypothetical protein [Planctomycetota bacterium]